MITSAGAIAPAPAVKSATSVVFLIGSDAVEQGSVASRARPGGNLTGFNLLGGEPMAKRLQLLSEWFPGLV